jgi:hypothetical protein
MIVLDPVKLRSYWDSIASGFQRDPLVALLQILLVLLILGGLIALFLIAQRRERRRRALRETAAFEAGLAKLDLSVSDRRYLEAVSKDHPRPTSLLNNLSAFNKAAGRMVSEGLAAGPQVARIRVKLGLIRPASGATLHSTAELPEGTSVEIILGARGSFPGVVESVEPTHLAIRTREKIAKGQSLVIQVARSSGLFSISSTSLGYREGVLHAEHSENVKRVQKRRYFRKGTRMPAIIQPIHPREPAKRTLLIDIGGGGARLENPGMNLQVGRAVILTLPTDRSARGAGLSLKGSIRRVADTSLSVVFDPLKDAIRDRIMKMVLH